MRLAAPGAPLTPATPVQIHAPGGPLTTRNFSMISHRLDHLLVIGATVVTLATASLVDVFVVRPGLFGLI